MWRHALRRAINSTSTARKSSLRLAGRGIQLLRLEESASRWGIISMMGLAAAATGGATVAFAEALDEKSFIMIKPDGVQRGLIADIIKRFESKGYKLVGIKVLKPSVDLAEQHYEEHKGKPFYPGLVSFLTSGPVVAMVWEGKEVIKTGRGLIGATNPLGSAPGTIRGDFGVDTGRNIIHGSDSVDSAQKEIALWFQPDELAEYEATIAGWVYESKAKL